MIHTPHTDHVTRELKRQAAQFGFREEFVYRGPADFVLQHGTWFHESDCPAGEFGPPNHCYGNAIRYAAKGERYFEGYALNVLGLVLPHAWTVREDRPELVLDRAWVLPGFCYVGVEFSVERADDATWNGDSHVLNDFRRGHPLFRQRWYGEPADLEWPESELLTLLRRGDEDALREYVDRIDRELRNAKA